MEEALKKKLVDAGLADVVTMLEKLTTELAAATIAIAEKDKIIEQKTNDVVGARREYKKLADMTQAEKDAMSEKERELQERQEAFDAQLAQFEKTQAETLQKEVDARRGRIFKKYAGEDAATLKELEDSFKSIVDHDKATTEEEIAGVAQKAWNMLGKPARNPVTDAMGDLGGSAGGEEGGTGFAESKEGKDLASAMGLPVESPKQGDGGAQA